MFTVFTWKKWNTRPSNHELAGRRRKHTVLCFFMFLLPSSVAVLWPTLTHESWCGSLRQLKRPVGVRVIPAGERNSKVKAEIHRWNNRPQSADIKKTKQGKNDAEGRRVWRAGGKQNSRKIKIMAVSSLLLHSAARVGSAEPLQDETGLVIV